VNAHCLKWHSKKQDFIVWIGFGLYWIRDEDVCFIQKGEIMNIYFCGSIRGGYQDCDLYQRIISYMKRKHKVLTEHIGRKDIDKIEEKQTDRDIYLQDTGWLKKADIVIAECTTPSLGVGYELCYSENHNKEVHIFFDTTRSALSAMLTGDSYFHIHPYKNEKELFDELNRILNIED